MTSDYQTLAKDSKERSLLAHFVIFALTCNVAGWLLSALHLLHAPGFLIAIPLIHTATTLLCGVGFPAVRPLSSRFWRWKQWLPAGFLLIAALVLISGILHAPNNMDALHSRVPRVAHWLMAERWEWFPANNNSQNTRSCGYEWMTAPLVSLFRTDRFTFIFNCAAFFLLPAACFGVLRGMGLGGRVSWAWMWLVPAGYCFALQAGGIGNDLTPSFFAAAAFAYGFRYKSRSGFANYAIAIAALGAMSACKPGTLPLLLPFCVIFCGMWKIARSHPVRSAALAVLVATGSFLPTAIFNIHHCGDWTGLQAENPDFAKVEPLVGVAGNIINSSLQNLAPPVFPLAGKWNTFFIGLFPEDFKKAMKGSFEPTGAEFILPDLQGEEWAGIGAGITYLLLFTALLVFFKGRLRASSARNSTLLLYAALFGSALLVYFAKTGLFTVARHISPYYLFLIALILLAMRPEKAMRSRLWKWAAGAAMASTVFMLVITPARPLWPARWFFGRLGESSSSVIQRAALGYSIYADRADALGSLRRALPTDAREIGFMSFAAGSEMPFWKPYGKMRVHHIRPGDSITGLRQKGMRHIVINSDNFQSMMGQTPEDWVRAHGGNVIVHMPFRITAQGNLSDWLLVELPPGTG
ncbi:MAG: hypothetical protein ACRCXD_16115 [Luteolibacter sp.]